MQALRANKMRAMLTMLGVIIGSGSIVLVVTVALGGKRYVLAQIEGDRRQSGLRAVVNPGETGTADCRRPDHAGRSEPSRQAMPQRVSEAAGTNASR